MPTTPPSIAALPSAPDPNNRATFNTLAYPWSAALPTFGTQVSAVATNVKANADEAEADAVATAASAAAAASSASTATTQASTATTQASNASASAAAAATYAAALVGTSTTSLAIAVASKTFTTQASKQFAAGQFVLAASAANSANYMHGQVTSYSGTTLIVDVQNVGGSGTLADWNLSVSGSRGTTGATGPTFTGGSLTSAINEARATVASHATTADIWGAAGNQINWTGTATTTAFPAATQAGAERVLVCAGACSFTAGANMLIDGVASAATVTCAANDLMIVRAVSTTQFRLTRVNYDGRAQVDAGRLLRITRYTTAGSGTWTRGAGTVSVLIRTVAGGGGGGGPNSGGTLTGNGGHAGGYAELYVASAAASYAYTVGAGGTGGGSGAAGTAGSATTIAGIAGGAGGGGQAGGSTGGATVAITTGGDLNTRGGPGEIYGSTLGGNGGCSAFGGGSYSGGAGVTAVLGGGGNGAGIGQTGGNGGPGYIEVQEYS